MTHTESNPASSAAVARPATCSNKSAGSNPEKLGSCTPNFVIERHGSDSRDGRRTAQPVASSVGGMASIFVTGSSDGIGQETARQLVAGGHRVVLHARDDARAEDAARAVPEASGVAVGDLSLVAGIRQAAQSASSLGPYDAVIHNAGVGSAASGTTPPMAASRIFAVNVLGPYLLTALMPLPPRLVYLTSGLESAGRVTWMTCSGNAGPGTACRPTVTPSSMTCCWRSPSRAATRSCAATRSTRAGSRPSWAARGNGRAPRRRADPGLARHERRPGRGRHRPLFQVAPRPASQPGRVRHQPAGGPARRLRKLDQRRTA